MATINTAQKRSRPVRDVQTVKQLLKEELKAEYINSSWLWTVLPSNKFFSLSSFFAHQHQGYVIQSACLDWLRTNNSIVGVFNRGILVYTIASLASTIQFLMKLQINQFWILKGHSTINLTANMSLMYGLSVVSLFHCTFHAWVGWVSEIKYGLIAAARGALTSWRPISLK